MRAGASGKPGGSDQRPERCLGSGSLWLQSLPEHKGSLHLRQGSALLLHTYQKYFFRLSIIIFEHCIPALGSP